MGLNRLERQRWLRFGQYLRQIRRQKKMGLRELSRSLARVSKARGFTASYLSRIESGTVSPPREHVLKALATALNVPYEALQLTKEGYTVYNVAESLIRPKYHHVLLHMINDESRISIAMIAAMLGHKQYINPNANIGKIVLTETESSSTSGRSILIGVCERE